MRDACELYIQQINEINNLDALQKWHGMLRRHEH